MEKRVAVSSDSGRARSSRWRVHAATGVVLAGLMPALAARAASPPQAAPEIQVRASAPGQHELIASLPGLPARLIHRTADAVRGARLVAPPATGAAFATWDEGPAAETRHFVALTLDGGATWSEPREISHHLRIRAGSFVPGDDPAPLVSPALASRSGSTVHLVQFATPGIAAWRDRLKALGAEVLGHVPEHAHIVRMTAPVRTAVAKEPFVRWIGPYHPAYRLHPEFLAELALAPGARPSAPRRLVLQTYTAGPGEKGLLADEIRALGGRVVEQFPDGYLLEAEIDWTQLDVLVHSEHLLWAELWTPPGEDMDIVREQCGANYVESVGGYTGQGVVGEVLDGGTMATHQDFDGIRLHGTTPVVGDHGTCTYGIVFGNGARDADGDAQATGVLPSAQGWYAAYGNLGNRYTHTQELTQAPIFASFQSNSWGDALTTLYNAVSFEMDDIIWQTDVAIFQSQSNAGSRQSRPQAWAKNIISIGGVRHYDTLTLADDCWCGGASVGPAEDGRIKPDLSFWYDDQYTTDNEPGGYSGGLYTPGFGGTSGATPMSAGTAGLVLQMWADNLLGNNPQGTTVFEKQPHASTLKALLVNTAEAYPFTGAASDLTRVHQGWGMPNARRFYDRAPLLKVVDETSPLRDLARDRWDLQVAAGQPELKITLAWTDRAGTTSATVHRVNDLDLRVTSPNATIYHGNVGLDAAAFSTAGGTRDDRNNVENVFISTPLAGAWVVEIIAAEINQDAHVETTDADQDYALVTYGATSLVSCASSVSVPTGVTATPAGDNRITVGWAGPAGTYKVFRAQGGCGGSFSEIATVTAPPNTYVDTTVSGGLPYGYLLRRVGPNCDSSDSACSVATTTGVCLLQPAFAGLETADATGAAACGVSLTWDAGQPGCAGPLRYNVYRSTTTPFTPTPANRIAACLTTTTFLDSVSLTSGQPYHYIVRTEDLAASPQNGACGGLEDTNLVIRTATPETLTPILAFDFETGLEGWTASAGTPAATTGAFVAGDPEATQGGTAQPELAARGAACLFTARNPTGAVGTDDVDAGEVVATSPLFDARGGTGARVILSRWFYNRDIGNDAGDAFLIDASSDDGQSWVNLETLDNNATATNAWTEVSFDLGSRLPLTATMRLRVRASDGTAAGNIIEAAIDDLRLLRRSQCGVGTGGTVGVIQGAQGPLLAVKALGPTSFVRLSWSPDCAGSTTYGIYRGDIPDAWTAFTPVAGMCDVAARNQDVAYPPGSEYYLVAPNDGATEGSLGLVAPGTRRPQGPISCYPRSTSIDSCAP